MAGVVSMSGKSGRKQWTLHDGPKGSLRRLRSQLAEDGCPESQVVLAKQLLDEYCELDIDKDENAKLGVYWLTKASEQGNLEATDMLRKCLTTGRGITEHNYYDVKSCLDMSQDEKLARRAAREMFASLSNGEEFITTEQLQRCMRDLIFPSASPKINNIRYVNGKNHVQRSLDNGVLEPSSDEDSVNDIPPNRDRIQNIPQDWSPGQGEKITEAALVSAAASYARGCLPVVSRVVCLVEPVQMELDAVPLLQRPFVYPLASLKRLYIWLVESLGRRGLPVYKFFFTNHLHVILLIFLHALFGAESIVLFVPLALYYLSFVIMIIATFQILQRKRELTDLRVWSQLFLNYSGGSLNPEEAEYQYCRSNLQPYGHFFLALLLNLILFPIIARQWTPQSEFTVIAVLLTMVTLLNFSWRDSRCPDLLTLFSFSLNVLAKYPYEMDTVVAKTWRFLDIKVPTFASYVVGNGIEFCLNFRVVFYLLIPMVFLKMAARDNWRGTYKTLIPHCVTLSWWQMAILSSQSATWYGLIRGALALVGMVLFLPIVGLASIILPIIATAKYMSESDLVMRAGITAVLGGLPFYASWYLRKSRSLRRYNWLITCVQLILGLSAGAFLSWPMLTGHRSSSDIESHPFEMPSELSWEQYQNYCHQPAWEDSTKAQIQVQCAQLEGIPVSWEGYVTNTRLKSIKNNLAFVLDQLPDILANPLRCSFGEPRKDNCESYTNELSKFNCKAYQNILNMKSRCHLDAWNWYEFEISVKMKHSIWNNNAQVTLLGDSSFTNFSLNIYPGDKIYFSGILTNSDLENESLLGAMNPHVILEEVGCHVCHKIDLKYTKRKQHRIGASDIVKGTYLGIKTVLNFILNPIVIFK